MKDQQPATEYTVELTYSFGPRTTRFPTRAEAEAYAHREGIWGYANGYVKDPAGVPVVKIVGQFTYTLDRPEC